MVNPVSFRHDRKEYVMDGGLNAHGRFIKLVETVGGRTNNTFIPVEALPQIIAGLAEVGAAVLALEEPPVAPEAVLNPDGEVAAST